MDRDKINQYIEHTNLSAQITHHDVEKLIEEAKEYQFYGVCLPPFWVKKAKRDIGKSGVKLITVIGFPLGYQKTESKLEEIKQAIKDGVDEVDVVLNVSAVKAEMIWPKIELAQCTKLAHESNVVVKLILETAYLEEEEIVAMTKMGCAAGADFIKTSTGFAPRGASLEDIRLIHNHLSEGVGIKASGGIKTFLQAKEMIEAGANRIGTSSGIIIVKDHGRV